MHPTQDIPIIDEGKTHIGITGRMLKRIWHAIAGNRVQAVYPLVADYFPGRKTRLKLVGDVVASQLPQPWQVLDASTQSTARVILGNFNPIFEYDRGWDEEPTIVDSDTAKSISDGDFAWVKLDHSGSDGAISTWTFEVGAKPAASAFFETSGSPSEASVSRFPLGRCINPATNPRLAGINGFDLVGGLRFIHLHLGPLYVTRRQEKGAPFVHPRSL
ncbi:MAG: hypothetical protein AAGD22_09365 [Verrucomicrobiota bacterium]